MDTNISFNFPPESKGTIKGGSMAAIELDKFRKYPVLKEIPPVKDENGEITEVQVLEEGKIPRGVQVVV